MERIANNTYSGTDAVKIFQYLDNYFDVYDLVANIQSISYRLHLGLEAQKFIDISFAGLKDIELTEGNICDYFGERRKLFKILKLDERINSYKQHSLFRTIKLIGTNKLNGTIIDIGSNDNKLGAEILKVSQNETKIIGVDIEDRNPILAKNLEFRVMQKISSIPFESDFANVVILRFSLHHMYFDTQIELLKDAYRVLKNGGSLIIIEDTYSEINVPIFYNTLIKDFLELNTNNKYKMALSFMDASSCFIYDEVMPFTYTFRSIEEWIAILHEVGFEFVNTDFWGLPFTSIFQAPLGIFHVQKQRDV